MAIVSLIMSFHYTGFERVYTVTDFLLFDSNELIYFEVFKPDNIKYIFKMRPAKDFGRAFVSFSFSVFWFETANSKG